MKVAYVTPYSSSDVHAWSGSVYFIREALAKAGCEIVPVDSLHDPGRLLAKVKEKAYRHLLGKSYLADRRPALLDAYAKQVSERCEAIKPDVIFSPGTIPIARLKTDIPTVFWTDATFAGITDYYALFSNLSSEARRDGNHVDEQALKNSSLAIYTSDWAAKTAIDHYGADPAKVKVVPYGANVTSRRTDHDVAGFLERRKGEVIRLLFVGVDWERKGGPIALEAAKELNARGLKTELHIVGCDVPGEVPDFVIRHGFVSKKTPEGSALLDRLFAESHFLIVPSRAECFGLVFAEASSFGLPSLAAITGGVPSVVSEKNGKLFPLEARGDQYADWIAGMMADRQAYERLSFDSLAEFDRRLNWEVAGKTVVDLMRQLTS
ncbi:MAG TPA: glycosyltransferase family 4 protein [Luteolibacter sp.]|nr:glycosyltransferase family 4 protein [Luteolibacter sp.]